MTGSAAVAVEAEVAAGTVVTATETAVMEDEGAEGDEVVDGVAAETGACKKLMKIEM